MRYRSWLLIMIVFQKLLGSSGSIWGLSPAFLCSNTILNNEERQFRQSRPVINTAMSLRRGCYGRLFMSGYGKASNYNWTEEAFEIELTVGPLPREALAKNIRFKATSNAVDLRYFQQADDDDTTSSPLILLDGDRKLRGRIRVDGTFWAFSDSKEDPSHRYITVTIEKSIRGARDDFDIVNYDWNGVYPKDEDEVTKRYYDKPEELNIREYAASMGVDIDNINMSMVDKTMFSSGLNLTQSSLKELSKAGLVNEVTVQGDGSEFVTNPKTGETQPFSHLGTNIGKDEILAAAESTNSLFDTSSPWSKAVPMEKAEQHLANKTAAVAHENPEANDEDNDEVSLNKKQAMADPVESLTVKRIKEILKAQGLSTAGKKKDLQTRLRGHVQSLLQQDERERAQ